MKIRTSVSQWLKLFWQLIVYQFFQKCPFKRALAQPCTTVGNRLAVIRPRDPSASLPFHRVHPLPRGCARIGGKGVCVARRLLGALRRLKAFAPHRLQGAWRRLKALALIRSPARDIAAAWILAHPRQRGYSCFRIGVPSQLPVAACLDLRPCCF